MLKNIVFLAYFRRASHLIDGLSDGRNTWFSDEITIGNWCVIDLGGFYNVMMLKLIGRTHAFGPLPKIFSNIEVGINIIICSFYKLIIIH